MLLQWIKSRRRRRIAAAPFPETWERWIQCGLAHDAWIDDGQRKKLRRLVSIFVAEKNWEGCRGLVLTDEMKVIIAAQACLLVIGLPYDEHFDHVLSILVYPGSYLGKDVEPTRGGGVIEGREARLGETIWRGPVVLSWPHAKAGGKRLFPGNNLVFHEFAHQLDMLHGRVADGTPPLESRQLAEKWPIVMEAEFRQLEDACHRGRPHLLDCYGATDRSEFFAVATEHFFELGRDLERLHPALYEVMCGFYQVDPARWG